MTAMGKKSKPKGKSNAMKYVKVAVSLAVLAAAGYFGYDWWSKKQAKAEAEAAAAAKAASDAAKSAKETAAANKPLLLCRLPGRWTWTTRRSPKDRPTAQSRAQILW
jgi:ABC-type phosphate transport system substrate-binding protein